MRKLRTTRADEGHTLAAYLSSRLGLSTADARARVIDGGVYVDGRRVRDPSAPLAAGLRIAIHDPPRRAGAPPAPLIVHVDASVVVAAKPSGLATQALRAGGPDLETLVSARVPGVRALHRLDVEASGLVLFTRPGPARAAMQAALRDGKITRRYVAVVAGHPPWDTRTLDAPIGRAAADPRRRAVHGASAEPAVSHVLGVWRGKSGEARSALPIEGRSPLIDGAPASRLELGLETGRTHQLRVHLADAGYPLLGDVLYADAETAARAPRLLLHAARLVWPGGEAVDEPPGEFQLEPA